jgi:RNA polymerase sigma-70 factor, ECF subfamily
MSKGNNWAEMMVAAQKGDAPVYNRLLTEISHYLLSYLKFKLNSQADAQDVLQEVLISIHKSRHTYDSQFAFKPWLFTITQCRLIEFWRKNSRRLEKNFLDDESTVSLLIAEAEVTRIEVNELQMAFAKLSDDQQNILKGLKFDGKSIKELAVELSMTVSAVKVAAHRAYKIIAEDLGMDL